MSVLSQPDIDSILKVFGHFSRYEGQAHPFQGSAYEEVVASKIKAFHLAGQPLSLLLPAAPWKNPNTDKVLSEKPLPDFGEELALARLNDLCEELGKAYPYGAVLTLVSDGPVYNDLLGIPDGDFWEYGVHLRKLAIDKGFSRLKFVRLADVLGLGDGEAAAKEEYLAKADWLRREMESRFLGSNFDLDQHILENKDTELTYQKYVKSAKEDLRWGRDVDSSIKLERNAEGYAAETQRVAKHMTKRLLAYEGALNAKFPQEIRLSIHRSTGKAKISVPLIPQRDGFGLMPWHSCVLVTAQGEYRTGFSKDFRDAEKWELVTKDGEPYFFREKHPDFDWPKGVQVSHRYGGAAVVRNTSADGDFILTQDLKGKLANLALRFGALEVHGFSLEQV